MNNMLLRSAQTEDLDGIYALTKRTGFGLTTLPKNKALLAERLAQAISSCLHLPRTPQHAYYLFVLEDQDTGKLVGTSAIEAQTGSTSPFYAYKLSKRIKTLPHHPTKNQHEDELLNLVNDLQGHTELCTLYLAPNYRKAQWGAFLSRARFLFMSQFPQQFSGTVIAEMRGVTRSDGHSPFWDALGYHFFHLSFAEADKRTLSTDKQFIADCMPEYPIYVKLLSPEAQAVIGKPHPSTAPAMQLLIDEGFYYNHYVDIFDAGPVIESPLSQIKTYQSAEIFTLKSIEKNVESPLLLLSNTSPNFRSTKAQAILNREARTCILSARTAYLLQLEPGALVRIAPF